MDENPEVTDSELMCDCGNMRFYVKFQDGDTLAVCTECGTPSLID